ncbi:helix-turn-helix transcriptional regulator [Frigoribacterium sp. Leaf172]|uniref:helix-turn-helix transcriptional regulator n=1 Tax=Frigoribacterium sp. Leaf172 TaxID=1736285 RepID=UPI000700F8F7|nr:helix-turn-helix transcriptional regulator [Frigoribacterium sp. Leaf172]KQR65772.1 XRE family transcriptional regulator [Frigoribacterium sp. Leaf172]
MDKRLLAEFLRSRRELLQPRDVGLSVGPRRRAPGLRREELAQLAGISTDCYARLEQQRAPTPSTQVATSLARALRLTLDERDHLFALIGHNAPSRFDRTDHVSPALMSVLDGLHEIPCLVQNDLHDTLAMNSLAETLLGDETTHTGLARSGFYRWFTDPTERRLYPPEAHEIHGRFLVARLRMATTTGSDTARAEHLAAELSHLSVEFVRLWNFHEVALRYDDCKVLLHPELGRIEIDAQMLFTENRSQTLLVLNPSPGSDSRSKLDLLTVIGRQDLGLPITPE